MRVLGCVGVGGSTKVQRYFCFCVRLGDGRSTEARAAHLGKEVSAREGGHPHGWEEVYLWCQ